VTDEVREVTQRLRTAAPGWAARDVEERIDVLGRWGQEFTARRDEFVAALAADTGRLALSELEVDWVLGALGRGSRWARELFASLSVKQSSDPTVTLGEAPVPLGLVGVISPWNFPLQLALIDAIPALLSGCVVVLKPSEITPTFAPILQATIEAVPDLAAVFAVIEGGPDTGREIVQSVDAVCFTGSVRTGRHVAAAAAEAFIPAFLELGGKDAVVVAADADLDVATSGILWGSTANTGQSCMSLERVYVEESVADEFIDEIVRKAEQVTLAVPGPADGDMGPFIDPRQADVVAGHLADAVSKGAKIACGGDLEEHGGRRYLRPTVVIGVDHTMALMTEETFGPVIPVMPVRDVAEAVRMANDSEYGLSAAVFAAPETARGIARQLLAGAISINDVCLSGLVPEGEKQSFKSSGLGPSRMGPASLRRFLRQRAVLTRTQPQIQSWWYGDATPKE
jgi:aldehyde dehydrogenase (NAD+)